MRLERANPPRDCQLRFLGDFEVGVRQPQIFAVRHAQNSSGLRGFLQTRFRGSPRPHLAGGQIQDAGLVALLGGFQ